MIDVQYNFFRDLDRRSLAEGFDDERCAAVVRMKRQAIEAPLNRANPVVAEVLAGRTTFVAVYDAFSRDFRGLRRFVPKAHDAAWNERLDHFARIVPNVRHFRRRSLLAADNPLNLALYGAAAGVALGVFFAFSGSGAGEPGAAADDLFGPGQLLLEVATTGTGFVLGGAAMYKYRIRDYKQIHAREAAGYMDLNYGFCRSGDDRGWAGCLRAEAAAARPTRPD